MAGPWWITILCLLTCSENIVSYDIAVSQVTQTETVVMTSNSSLLDEKNISLSHSITTMPYMTKSLQNDSKISPNNVHNILSTETNTLDKVVNSLQDAYTNAPIVLKNMVNQVNSSKSQNGTKNIKLEPVQVKNIDKFPIKLKNVTSNSTKETQHPSSDISSIQKPEKPAQPIETKSNNPNVPLIDRSAFVGDHCATGYVKVNGKCVEEV